MSVDRDQNPSSSTSAPKENGLVSRSNSHRRRSVRARSIRISRDGQSQRLSWQSFGSNGSGDEDEFVDAAEYIARSSRSSRLYTDAGLSEPVVGRQWLNDNEEYTGVGKKHPARAESLVGTQSTTTDGAPQTEPLRPRPSNVRPSVAQPRIVPVTRENESSVLETREDETFVPEARETENFVPAIRDTGGTKYATVCEDCGNSGRDVNFCNACKASFCPRCWEKLFTHRANRNAVGGIPHEKTRPAVAEKVRDALAPPMDDSMRERLHKDDMVTSWFGIERPSDSRRPVFQDYGRFAELMSDTNPFTSGNRSVFLVDDTQAGRDFRTPTLVSFVGETGAGKSTLIKLLIDLAPEIGSNVSSQPLLPTNGTPKFATPVIGATGAHLPTSEDVHLYLDPRTATGSSPILFADCEGLDGGEREPVGAFLKKKARLGRSPDQHITGRISRAIKIISERELYWADAASTRSRNFAIENLYPRLLYTFSDVIVFALKNPRVIEHVFERLIKWAAAAIETSSNQPILPHAIIVLNASENNIDPSLWDVRTNTSSILDSIAHTVNRNETFKKYSQWWRERGKVIDTLEQLVLSYYSSVVVLRVPADGRPSLMQEQVEKLYSGLLSASVAARDAKQNVRMLLDVEDLQSYLQYAFNHFSDSLASPFDFVQASFLNSPIPPDFGGHIVKLAIQVKDHWKSRADAAGIFHQLSYMVASCIMFDSARNKIRGNAEQIFGNYVEHVDAALENFCDQHWPCEYGKPGSHVRCVNVRSGHSGKGHQGKDGKVIGAGNYVSKFCFADYHQTFRENIFLHLHELLEELRKRIIAGEKQEEAGAKLHRNKVLDVFYRHVAQGSKISDVYSSHTACFCCLFDVPEHALPCGHVLCTSCVRIYGLARGLNDVELMDCPIDAGLSRTSRPWRIHVKPKSAGTRILLLEGGGVRGIVELEALRAIENAIGVNIPVRCFFDMIVGTSTGGIIALGIGAKCWSLEDCTYYFETLVQKAFSPRKGVDFPGISFFVENWHHSKYRTKPFEEALQEIFTKDERLFGGRQPFLPSGSPLKVAVTATSLSGKRAVVFANYNRKCSEKLPYSFYRSEKFIDEFKIWEAARATSAAPTFFREFHHEPSQKAYVDGAIYHNNPVQIAEQERKLVWPELEDSHPDIVVSLGTAFSPSLRRVESAKVSEAQRGMISQGSTLLGLLKNHMTTSIECERIWNTYLASLPKSVKFSRFVRIDPELGVDVPEMDDVQHMARLQLSARQHFERDHRIRRVALQLLATTFYFQLRHPVEELAADKYVAEGRILCRFAPGSQELRELGKFLQRSLLEWPGLCFIPTEQRRSADPNDSLLLTPNVIKRMKNTGRFDLDLAIYPSSKLAVTEILLFFNKENCFPISGFPRSLFEDGQLSVHHRELTRNSNRWAGGSFRSRVSRKIWTAPDLRNDYRLQPQPIADYEDQRHGLQNFSYGRHQSKLFTVQQDAGPATGSMSTRNRGAYLRDAFRALARPILLPLSSRKRPTEVFHELADTSPADLASASDNAEREIYHSWIASLHRPAGDLTSSTETEIPGCFELSADHIYPVEIPSVPPLYELGD